MSYRMRKPAYFGSVGCASIVSPASLLEVADWWDAWRLMWWAVGTFVDQDAVLWESTFGT